MGQTGNRNTAGCVDLFGDLWYDCCDVSFYETEEFVHAGWKVCSHGRGYETV